MIFSRLCLRSFAPLAVVLLSLLRVTAEDPGVYPFSTERLLSDLNASQQNVRLLALYEARGRHLDERAVARICEIVLSDKDSCREEALQSLLTLYPLPAPAARSLFELLARPATPLHMPLAHALFDRGSWSVPILDLFGAEPRRPPSVGAHRAPLLDLIGRLGPRAGSGGRAIAVMCLTDADEALVMCAMHALLRHDGIAGDEIRQHVVSPSERIRLAATFASAQETPQPFTAIVNDFITHRAPAILRQQPMQVMIALGLLPNEPARQPSHAFRQLLVDANDDIATAAVTLWGRRGCTWAEVVDLVPTLTSAGAAAACASIMPRQWDQQAVEKLTDDKSGKWGRWCVARYLTTVDPEHAKLAITTITHLPIGSYTVTERTEFIRALRHAIQISTSLTPEMAQAIQAMPMLDDDSEQEHLSLLGDVLNRGLTDVEEVLFAAAGSNSRHMRTAAIRALAGLDHWNARTIAQLVKALEDDAASVVVLASEALRERASLVTWEMVGAWASDRGIIHRKAETRREAYRMVEVFGSGSNDARDAMMRVIISPMNDNDLLLALRALRGGGRLTAEQAIIVRDLMRQHRQPRVRIAAAASLIPSGRLLGDVHEALSLELKSPLVPDKDKPAIQALIESIPAN